MFTLSTRCDETEFLKLLTRKCLGNDGTPGLWLRKESGIYKIHITLFNSERRDCTPAVNETSYPTDFPFVSSDRDRSTYPICLPSRLILIQRETLVHK